MSIPGAPDDDSRTEVLADEGRRAWGSFHLATLTFHRARQLRAGSRPRVDAQGHTLLRVAFLEVTAGTVPWRSAAVPPLPQ
jgi:hypothetical protein